MIEVLGSIWWLVVTLGLLVTFHEFGHFWVARRCGVKVLRFSVGFGRALWKHVGRDGTEYVIAAIPLGGYVKMLDAREADVPEAQHDEEFTAKPVWQRIAIVAAGPLFNLVFAIAAFWLIFMLGKPDYAPIVGEPQGMAAAAGFHSGDRVIGMDGEPISTWTASLDVLADGILRHEPVSVRVRGEDGEERSLVLPLDELPAQVEIGAAFSSIGLRLQAPPAVAGSVLAGDPADRAGVKVGDRIVSINDRRIENFAALPTVIAEEAGKSPRLDVVIERDDELLSLRIDAKNAPLPTGDPHWIIGVGPLAPEPSTLRYAPVRALGAALESIWDKTTTTFSMIGGMLSGETSTRNLAGVITIAQVANTSASMGLAWFLEFLGLISLSLAILNLLPIPILDGGHLLYYLIEIIKGSPLSEQAMIAGQYVGMALLAALMGLALYNDILRLAS